MPIREYECSKGHRTEKLVFGEAPESKPCPECQDEASANPMFHVDDVAIAVLITSSTWTPTDDYKRATAREKYKGDAQTVKVRQ